MQARTLHLTKPLTPANKEASYNIENFICLCGDDVVTAKVSDHHPMIHDRTLFWNIMMQGKMRKGRDGMSFNNGFGIIETEENYRQRLHSIGEVIVEILTFNPFIDTITLCEGPILPLDLKALIEPLQNSSLMKRFFKNNNLFYRPNCPDLPNWGLLMCTDNQYTVQATECDLFELSTIKEKLANRFQLWKLKKENSEKYVALCHFPFSGDEQLQEKEKLSLYGKIYSALLNKLINKYEQQQLIICGDFNFNPYLINKVTDRAGDKVAHHNSIILNFDSKKQETITKTVTVDGILLSKLEKQRLSTSQMSNGLFSRLKLENKLCQSSKKQSRL